MARILTTADYGILTALFSLIMIFAIPSETIQTIMAKYSSLNNSEGSLKNLFKKSLKKSINLAILIFIGYFLISIFLYKPLKIPFLLLILTGLFIFASFLSSLSRGFLQGRKMFLSLGLNMVSEGFLKLVLGILFVLTFLSLDKSNLTIYGVIFGVVISSFFAFGISLFSLKNILKSKEQSSSNKGIYIYLKPSFVLILIVLVFFSLDVLMAKILFSPEQAGIYSIAAVLAKIIFVATQPISKAMFPLTSNNSLIKSKKLFKQSLKIILSCISLALIIIYFGSSIIIELFTGRVILESANILFFVSIAISLLSITNLYILYNLSINKTKNYTYLIIFPIIQAISLYMFSSSLLEFSIALVSSATIFLIGSILVFER
jgi:O-antigen/teichoic acid export membrane protein